MRRIIREEVINVVLAQTLRKRGLNLVIPEIIQNRRRPDVIVELYGLQLLIEGRKAKYKKTLFADIKEKLEEGYGDIGIAMLYSEDLYEIKEIGDLERKLEDSRIAGAIFYWGWDGLKKLEFNGKAIVEIVEIIRGTLDIYIQNNILKQQIFEVKNTIEKIVRSVNVPDLWLSDKELLEKLMSALGISDYGEEES